MATLINTKRSLKHHIESKEPPLKRRKLNQSPSKSNLLKSAQKTPLKSQSKPQWTPQSPSPSPPSILQYTEKPEIEILILNNHTNIPINHPSPSPPWGRSPSPPPSAYFHKPTKKKSRWDQKHENALQKPTKNGMSSLITAGVNSLIHSINLQQQKQQKIEPLLLDEHGNPLNSQQEEEFYPTEEQNIIISDSDTDEFYDSDIMIKPATRVNRSHAFKFIKHEQQPAKYTEELPCMSHLDDSGLEWLDFIPAVEWWDKPLLTGADYSCKYKREMITSLIENPRILRPELLTERSDAESSNNGQYILTKKERKKMRRIVKKQQHELRTDEIRLGLREAPEPRLKLSNIIRVLGAAAIRDPTAAESIVRAQMWKRKVKHELHNAKNMLNPQEKREKKRKQLQEDTSKEVHVGVFVVCGVFSVLNKTKVRLNAQQRNLTGALVMLDGGVCGGENDGNDGEKIKIKIKDEFFNKSGVNVDFGGFLSMVIVEGGPKGVGKFEHLVMNRIKWDESVGCDGENDGECGGGCRCDKVWQGTVAKRAFQSFHQLKMKNELDLKKFLMMYNVMSYWDMVKNSVNVTSNV